MDLLRSNDPGTFHLVLTDFCMPLVNGLQLLQYVKQEENLRSVPVIMMSSIDKGDTVFECVSSGAEEYLVKPVTRKEVQHMWQHVLRKRSALATVPQADGENTGTGPSSSAEENNNNATGELLESGEGAVAVEIAAAPSGKNSLKQKTNVAPAADLEGAKQFLLLMRRSRQAEAAEIQRQLVEIDQDIAFVRGGARDGNAAPAAKRQRTSSTTDPDVTNTINTTNTTSTTNWTAISSRLDSLEPLYFDRRRGASAAGSSAIALDSLARDLNVLSQSSSVEVCASLRAGDIASPQEMVCCADFAADDRHFATVSVSRSVKVFDFEAVLSSPGSLHVPVWQATTRSKLSSVSWNAYVRPHLLTSDYDGLIQLWDASAAPSSAEAAQFEEHSRRVWSIDFSRADPMRFVSGSDDATVRLWSVNQDSSATVMRAPANVCSVQFSPTNGNLVAAGCANHRVYMYDLRKANTPAAVISGPNRAVSYVRFMGPNSLVAASTDNAIRVWDVQEALTAGSGGPSAAGVALPPRCVFSGHKNERNFVGLSATDDGYIATGSEDNSIHTYYKTLPFSVASYRLGDGLGQGTKKDNDKTGSQPSSSHSAGTGATTATTAKKSGSGGSSHRTFVSSVCWARGGRHCLAANSQGVLSVLHLK
jgi:WD40 repeat protein